MCYKCRNWKIHKVFFFSCETKRGAFKKIIFFMKKSHFLVIGDLLRDFWWFLMWFLVGTGEPPPYCNKIPTKSPFCMVVVLVSVRHPPPRWDKIPRFAEFFLSLIPLPQVWAAFVSSIASSSAGLGWPMRALQTRILKIHLWNTRYLVFWIITNHPQSLMLMYFRKFLCPTLINSRWSRFLPKT